MRTNRGGRGLAAIVAGLLIVVAAGQAPAVAAAKTPGDGHYGFQNYKSGLFLQPSGSSTAVGARMVQAVIETPGGGDLKGAQNWWEKPIVGSLLDEVRFQAGNSSLHLGIDQGSTSAGAHAIQAQYSPLYTNQRWIVRRSLAASHPSDIKEIYNVKSGLCLGVDRASTSVGAYVMQFRCDGAVNQGWRIVDR